MPPKNNTISSSADTSTSYSENKHTGKCSGPKTNFELASDISKKIRRQVKNFNKKKRALGLLLQNSAFESFGYNGYLNTQERVNHLPINLAQRCCEIKELVVKYDKSEKKISGTVESCKMRNTAENSKDLITSGNKSSDVLNLSKNNRKRQPLGNMSGDKSEKQMYNEEKSFLVKLSKNCGSIKHTSEDTFPHVDEQAKLCLKNKEMKPPNQSKVVNSTKKKKQKKGSKTEKSSRDTETHKGGKISFNLHNETKRKYKHEKIKDLTKNADIAEGNQLPRDMAKNRKQARKLRASKKKVLAQSTNHRKYSEKCSRPNNVNTKNIEQSQQFFESIQNSSSCNHKNKRSNRQLSVSCKDGSLQNSNEKLKRHRPINNHKLKRKKQKSKERVKRRQQNDTQLYLNSDSGRLEQVIVCSGTPLAFIDTKGSCEDDSVSKSRVTQGPLQKSQQDVTSHPHIKLERESTPKIQFSRKRYFLQDSSAEEKERLPRITNNTACANQDAPNNCLLVFENIKQENHERKASNCCQEKSPVIKRKLLSNAEPVNTKQSSCTVPRAQCTASRTSITVHVLSPGPVQKRRKPSLPIVQALPFSQDSNESEKSDAYSEEEESDVELPQLFQIPKGKLVHSSRKGKYHSKATATNLKQQFYSTPSGKKLAETMRATVTDTDKVMILSVE